MSAGEKFRFFFISKMKREKNEQMNIIKLGVFFSHLIDKNGSFYVWQHFLFSFVRFRCGFSVCVCVCAFACMWQMKHVVEILFKINAFFPFSFHFHSLHSFVCSHIAVLVFSHFCLLSSLSTSLPLAIFQIHIQFRHTHTQTHSQPHFVPLRTHSAPAIFPQQ